MAANEFYISDDESESEANGDIDFEGDADSNCSLLGSTNSNEDNSLDDIESDEIHNICGAPHVDHFQDSLSVDKLDSNHFQNKGNGNKTLENDYHCNGEQSSAPSVLYESDSRQRKDEDAGNEVLNPSNLKEYCCNQDNISADVCCLDIKAAVLPCEIKGAVDSSNGLIDPGGESHEGAAPVDKNFKQLCSQFQASESMSSFYPEKPTGIDGTKRANNSANLIDVEAKRMKTDKISYNSTVEATGHSEKLSVIEVCDDYVSCIDSLPDELLIEIFGKLSLNTLINIAPVCKRWFVLSKHKSLWLRVDMVYDYYNVNHFSRIVRAARYLRTVDVSYMQAEHGEGLLSLLNGPESVRRFSCFCVASPIVIVELLERYKDTLEELNISLSDERLSYGEGGTFKDGVLPRPGYLLQLISEMKNLHVLRFTGTMPSIGHHQGRINPKWYFGELENPELKLQAIEMKFENPREILVQRFIIPFLRSKVCFLKEVRLTTDIWENKEVQAIIRKCEKLEAIVRFPIENLCALKNLSQQFFIDFILGSWTDFKKVQNDLADCQALSHIYEVSLRFCDQLYIKSEEQVADKRLETFLPLLASRLKSCKRVHIYRWDAAPPFVESVHSTHALKRFLHILSRTIEEVHISDAFRGGRHLPQLMRVIRESVPHLKSRGIAVNRLGNKGLLFSTRRKQDSVIPNTTSLLLEHGKIEFGSQ